MNYLLLLTVFIAAVFAASNPSPFDAFVPKDEKKIEEYKKTAALVTEKKAAITACNTEKDAAAFKACIAKIENLPKLFVDNFPEKYTEEKAVETAMEAYSKALVDPNVKLEKKKDVKPPTLMEKVTDVLFYIMYAAVGLFVIVGFVAIVIAYFAKKNDNSDL